MDPAGDAVDDRVPPRRRSARRTLLLAAWGVLLVSVLAAGALRSAGKEEDERGSRAAPVGPSAAAVQGKVARGRYLVSSGSCNGPMTDEDLGAVYAYLRSMPAIRNQVPDSVIVPMAPPAILAGK